MNLACLIEVKSLDAELRHFVLRLNAGGPNWISQTRNRMPHEEHRAPRAGRKTKVLASAPGLVLLGFLAMAGALLFTEHRAHIVLGALIWIILVAGLVLPTFTQGGWRGSNRRDGG